MRLRSGILLALLIALVAIFLSSFLIGGGLRLWISWQARRQGIQIEMGTIETPLFRPATIQRIHITDPRTNSFEIEADHLTIDLNLARILAGTLGRDLRNVSVEKVQVRITRSSSNDTQRRIDWATVQKMLPNRFTVANFELRLEGKDTMVSLQNGSISASEIEAGRFTASELVISSPLLHQTFLNLRGATKWQENRLTLGGITLGRGLDLQSLTVDFSRLSKQRADFQFDLDTFGGKIRASFADEWRPGHSLWTFAGSGNDISLSQTSEALGFTDRLGGSLRACKFTFRGDPHDLEHATASVWTELTGLSWRDHAADTIMLGAVFYNRRIQLQQLYLKQRNNELTLSGEGSLGSKPNEWLAPDFRSDISGSINDLGQFASLFGAQPGDFAGQIAVEGTMDTRGRRIGGHIMATGKGLSIFKTRIDDFTASLGLKASQLEIEQLDLSRKKDWLHAEGRIDLGAGHNYSGSVSANVDNLTEYLSIFGLTIVADAHPAPAHFQFAADSSVWNGNVTLTCPESRPIDIGVISLPLWIGETPEQFAIRPLNLILSVPMLSFANSPRWLGLGVFRGGIVSGGIHVSGTLRHPTIDGDMQLIEGKMESKLFGATNVAGRVNFTGSHGLIDFIRIANNDADLSLIGEIDAANTDQVVIDLTSNLALFEMLPAPHDCINRISFSRAQNVLAPTVRQMEYRGNLFSRSWTLTLRPESTKSPAPPSLDDRTIPLCPADMLEEKTLSFGIYLPPEGRPALHRKRSRHR
ncbi:MAG TPA: hypothetical protein VEI58_04530 [Chthoniobacterales bacterium]|nr:hypothetical protein [Chthoniobacterales bacterium]